MSELIFRDARHKDLATIVAMLADDELGRTREDAAAPETYSLALGLIEGDSRNRIIIVEKGGAIVGCMQLTFIHGLSRKGMQRAIVEAVRVVSDERSTGIGEKMMQHAMEEARKVGCGVLQLTSDKKRTRAHAFYKRLGFSMSHEGFKIEL
jgi:GNAT superfamily N-acetyltransferase